MLKAVQHRKTRAIDVELENRSGICAKCLRCSIKRVARQRQATLRISSFAGMKTMQVRELLSRHPSARHQPEAGGERWHEEKFDNACFHLSSADCAVEILKGFPSRDFLYGFWPTTGVAFFAILFLRYGFASL